MTRKIEPAPARRRPAAPPNRRGDPEVVEKRRAARHFNDLLLGHGPPGGLDGRTEKKRQRLLQELHERTQRGGKRELKPIDVLSRVQALLDLGEPLASIRKACAPPRLVESSSEVVEGVRRLHVAYAFAPEAYRFVGLDEETLRRAGVLGGPGPAKTRRASGIAPARSASRGRGVA